MSNKILDVVEQGTKEPTKTTGLTEQPNQEVRHIPLTSVTHGADTSSRRVTPVRPVVLYIHNNVPVSVKTPERSFSSYHKRRPLFL